MILQEHRKKKRRRKILLRILILLLVIAGLVLCAFTLFQTKEIRIEGNEIYDDATISQVIQKDPYSEYTWYLYAKYNWMKKENMPFIDEMEVSFNSPSSLTFYVYEKSIIGCFLEESSGNYNYFDKDGIIIEQSPTLIEDVVEIEGLNVENSTIYEAMELEDHGLLTYVLTLTQCLDKYGLKCQKILVGEFGRVDLVMGAIQVAMGKNTLTEEKIMRLSAIYPSISGKSGTIDLESFENESGEIIFREKSDK